MNKLFYGDNLEILRKHISDQSVDLIYLDPPFNSKKAYNVIFPDKTNRMSSAQIQAFEDTWSWSDDTQKAFDEIMYNRETPDQLKDMMKAFRSFMGENQLMAYITMMAIRLVELKRVLKETGSLYLHCDPIASHYLKILLDQIFGLENYRNEIVWHYKTGGASKRHLAKKHDIILFYTKTDDYHFDPFASPDVRTEKAIARAQTPKGARISANDVHKIPMDVWQIQALNPMEGERLGYPTQKPAKLLSRIIKLSCPKNGTVLDPFVGCGTAVAAAEKLGREWIGIDITHLAISLIKKRLIDHFPDIKYEVIGEPNSVEDARELFRQSAFQFESWAVSLLGGQPFKSKGGGDSRIDGLLYFKDFQGQFHKIIIEVKGGGYQPNDVRALGRVLKREDAPMGVLIALNPPTKGMRSEAATMGGWQIPGSEKKYPVLQILTIEDIFDGKKPELPDTSETLKKASREIRETEKHPKLL